MSHRVIYTCDICGGEIEPYKRYLFTLPALKSGEGGIDEDLCEGCARRVKEAVDVVRMEVQDEL